MNKINRPKISGSEDTDLRQIDKDVVDYYNTPERDFPIIERLNNAIIWPEGPKGRIDLKDTYEISSVPEDPGTPMESVDELKNKKVIPTD